VGNQVHGLVGADPMAHVTKKIENLILSLESAHLIFF